jgi:hypothetical protein
MTGNTEEKFCYFKQLGLAVCFTAFLEVFNPLVTNWRTFEIFIILNTLHKRLQVAGLAKTFNIIHYNTSVYQVFYGWLNFAKWKGII